MSRIPFRALAFVGMASVAAAVPVAGQERPAGLLNSLEVKQLVSRDEPADNARLSAHFSALAEQYSAEASRHLAMSQSFTGNPSHGFGTSMSVHCKRLADLNTESAATARELAAYHARIAGGTPATPPHGAARLESGAGAPAPTTKELTALAAKARTPAEHGALGEYFQALAKRYTASANEHATLAAAYRGTKIAPAAVHQDHLASLARDAAREATQAADMHKQLATGAR